MKSDAETRAGASAGLSPVDYDPFAGEDLARVVPTTEAQREMWLADQLEPQASLAYNESASLTIQGRVDPAAMQQALQLLAQRHEMLCATLSGDGINLMISGQPELPMQSVDLTSRGESEGQAKLARLRVDAVTTRFDLVNGPLFRAVLVLLSRDRSELILTGHHIVYDGWSCGVVATEIMKLYESCRAGAPVNLAPAESFADYALAERDPEHLKAAEADSRYWLSLFDASIPVLELPTDHARPARRSFHSHREDLLLDKTLSTAIRQFGARQGSSLFATMFAMFGGLMARLSGNADVVIGVPAAGQSASGKDLLVGHCVNLLPIRVATDCEAPIGKLIEDARDRVLDAYEHQSCTFGGILKLLQVARDPSRLPLVQVLFNVDAAIGSEDLSPQGLKVELRSNPRLFENFELFLNASQINGEIMLELQYNTDLFDRATVQRWLALFRTALERVVAEPSQSLAAAFSPTADDMALLDRFNGTALDFPRNSRIESLIARQTEATPESIAVVAGNARLTYRDLDRRANGVAALLREQGTKAGALIGLSCGRNEHMIIGLLGILKSGAGYVPLDPSFPAERLEYMANDAGLRLVVSDRGATGPWKFGAIKRIDVDAIAPADANAAPAPSGSAEDVAYVIYTSGSTGQPKGVRVPHRSVANLIQSVCREPGIDAHHVVLSITTLSFDIAVSEVIIPLTAGARIVVAGSEETTDGERLRALIEAQGVNFIDATPSTWRLLLASGWKGSRDIRAICTGEPLPPDLGRELLTRVGELWNGYGPTETTVWSSFYRVQSCDGTVPIGHPVANTQIHVVDSALRPQPIGVVGELFIGGEGVTLGYMNRPDLTAERFLPDPHRGAGALWYKTGDLGRWRADGVLECLGRSDHQVKVRGYRIELGEIEATLTRQPSIASALVITREDHPGDVRLVAYAVPRADKLDAASLRDALRQSLPEYMIPQHIVELAALPLLPNGKINRAALPRPDVERNAEAGTQPAPRNPLERQLLDLMEQVLNLPGLGIGDNFFSLGGHSLLASQFAARIGKGLDKQIPLRAIFDAPTVERLAEWIAKRDKSDNSARWDIPRRADRAVAPLSLMQQRLWFLEQMDPGRPTYNTPSAHRLRGKLDEAAFNRAFAEMIRRQDVLRTVVEVIDETPMQVILPELQVDLLPVEDLRGIPEGERDKRLMEKLHALAAEPLELTEAPLFRTRLFRTGDEEYVLYFGPHHIIWDGWSFDILYPEMSALYQAQLTGRECSLPAPAVAYGDFAAWHGQWMQGEELASQVAHWKQRLGGTLEPLAVPTDLPRPAVNSGRGSSTWLEIDTAGVEAARSMARRVDATLFMSTLATFVLALHKLTGQTEIIVGTPVRGRQIEELESVMGMFVNALPLRITIDPEAGFLQLLRNVRDAVIDAFKYPDVPFEQLVRELNVPRDRSRFPIYQALFSYQDAREREALWGGLEHEMVHVLQPGLAEDVALWFLDRPNGLVGGLSYNTDIISAETAELLRKRYQHLSATVLANPETPLWQLPLAPDEQKLLAQWNATSRAYPKDSTISNLIERQAHNAPHRIALSHGDASLSYAELDQRTNRLANLLRTRRLGRGKLIGLCVERGLGMVIAQLAILKSGAAYVPLDPSYPPDRLKYMAEDAGLAALVSESALSDLLPWPREQSVLLDADADLIAAQAESAPHDPSLHATPDSVAYVIYTSGSTGKPKGVQVPQRAVVNFLTSMQHEPGLSPDDKLVAVTTLSFDIAVLELLLPLTVGAEVVLAGREQSADPRALSELMTQHKASIMQATPGTWRMLLDAGWKGTPGFKALVGGEALTPELAARLLPATTELWNMYGPTETTVWSTCWKVVSDAPGISIGRPIANTSIWILDEHHQACPIGAAGEIWIGGDGVTLGYLNRPELSAERFIADQFSQVPGAKLYGTGDRGRWRADGLIEHLGRNDFQVKVRGFRIELGEIESGLDSHDGVAQSVVTAREDIPGDVRLVAYFVPRGPAPDSSSLRDHLRANLPAYMLPQHFVPLAQLPLLPNGKINRNALPRPEAVQEKAAPRQRNNAPQSETEKLLASVWAELLKTADIQTDDNFFDIGGHSLLAMQAILAMETRTGKRMNPRRFIFESLRQIATAYDETEVEVPKAGALSRMLSGILGKRKK